MTAQPPILDKRNLKLLLEQLQYLALIEVPEWTPPPEGDVGTMLQRIYARLMELALQRLNQVPEKNLLAFLDTMGVSLLSPSPAQVPLTFSLTPGAAATFVPKGTQAGTQPSGQQPTVIFETEDDLTVIPAQITQAYTIDPTWDRYRDQTSNLSGESEIAFTPFIGTKQLPHVLYFGDDTLLNFSRAASVVLSFIWESDHPPGEIVDFFSALSYCYRTQDILKTLSPTIVYSAGNPNPLSLYFAISDLIDQETIQGVGLMQSIQSRWLRAVLTTPFPDALIAQDLRLPQLKLRVSASGLLPDLAFSNTAPVDVTKDFFPFGETPRIGDAFYIGSQEAFKSDGIVRFGVGVRSSPPPTLIWEYGSGFNSGTKSYEWTQLPQGSIVDSTNSFTQSGLISFPRPVNMAPTVVNDSEAFWFRVRIADGSYRFAPRLSEFRLQTTLAAPINQGQSEVTLTVPEFARVDVVLLVGDEFVQVAEVGNNSNVLQVAPQFRRTHDAGTFVEYRGVVSRSFFVGELRGAVAKDTNILIVFPREVSIARDMLLLLGEPNQSTRELIHIKDVSVSIGQSNEKLLVVTSTESLQFDHHDAENLRSVTSDFLRVAETQQINFLRVEDLEESFLLFGKTANAGDQFYFGMATGVTSAFPPNSFPSIVELHITIVPNVQLIWDFLGANGWQTFTPLDDETKNFLQEGDIALAFPKQPLIVAAQVNGQSNHWIRVRIANGNYGLPTEYIPAGSPSQGFKVNPDTGNLNPPVITKLTLGYEAERTPTVVTQSGFLYTDQSSTLEAGFTPFTSAEKLPPIYADTKPGFYLGFDAVFPEQPVRLYIEVSSPAFSGSVVKESFAAPDLLSELPPLHWEYFNGRSWSDLTVLDHTNNFTESGTVEFLTPTDMAPLAKFDLTEHFWIRASSPKNNPFDTQHLSGVFLNTIPAIQAVTVQDEVLGSSNGQPNQILNFARTPILSEQQVLVREPEAPSGKERAAIEAEEGKDAVQARANSTTGEPETWVRWHEVNNFIQSDLHSRHYILDRTTGVLKFGDGKRGLIPPIGTSNIVATYLNGGGPAGNVPKATIVQIKSTLPGIATVINPVASDGGAVAETVPMVEDRGPQTLKHRDRAVTCSDWEWLVRQATGTRIARTRCLPNVNRDLYFEPGWVTLIIIPQGTESKLVPSSELIREVEDYLNARAFVGLVQQTPAKINVLGPGYIQVAVVAEVVPQNIDETQSVKQQVIAALNGFFHPLTGGPNHNGWEFTRDVYESEVSQVMEGVSGVSYVKSLQLVPNLAQHWFTLTPALKSTIALPEGSSVITPDRQKVAILAEPIAVGETIDRIAVKGFKEGDRITKVQDLMHSQLSETKTINDKFYQVIAVDSFNSDAVGFPSGSLVTTFDGKWRGRLFRSIPRSQSGQTQIFVEGNDFPNHLKSADIPLTIFYPFPMTITAVIMDAKSFKQRLNIEPYETEVIFPARSLFASLDNRVRLPLLTDVPAALATTTITSIEVQGFINEVVKLARRDGSNTVQSFTIQQVKPVEDIVYLDDNFLVYPGAHRITMLGDTGITSRR